ncbi:MAG: hypothetical protein HEP71_04230 [Roseivirga sp.]|nr:hypothetical protein [Roseivirga sp.]
MSKAKTSILLRITNGKVHSLITCLLIFIGLGTVLSLIFIVEGIAFVQNNYGFFAHFGIAFVYIIFVTRLIHNVHVRDFHKLLGYSGLAEKEQGEWRDKIANHRSQLVETLVAICVGILHAYLQGFVRIFDGTSKFLLYDVWASLHIIVLWVLITLSTSIFIRNMTLMNELSQKLTIDLLNMDKFVSLTRSGVWSILAFIGAYSILFIRGFDSISSINLADPAILVLGPSVFWMIRTPLKGFRKRVIEEKRREMAIIDAAIEGDHEILKKSRIGANLSNINVIDLISYKRIIQNTFEIPINIPVASRFIFYLIIPILTWIAASMVDKVIDYLIK